MSAKKIKPQIQTRTYRTAKLFTISVLSSSILGLPAIAAETSFFERMEQKASSLLASNKISASASISQSITEGINLGIGYRYLVEPTFDGKFYTRVDQYQLKNNLQLSELVSNISPIFINFNHGSSITIVKQYPNHQEASIKSPELDTDYLPLSAEKAKKMKLGDFVMMPVNLNLVGGISASTEFGILEGRATAYYMLSGDFQLQVLRMNESLVRLRLLAGRSNGKGASAGIYSKFRIFDLGPANWATRQLITGSKVLEISSSSTEGHLFLADYIFNLADQQAAAAYDAILKSPISLKQIVLANPLGQTEKLDQSVIGDLTLADQLIRQDITKTDEQKRVRQIFKGTNDYQTQNNNVHLGVRSFNIKAGNAKSMNHVKLFNPDSTEEQFIYPVNYKHRKLNLFFNWINESSTKSTSALIPADQSGKPSSISDYVVTFEEKDTRLFEGERSVITQKIRRLITDEIIKELGIEERLPDGQMTNAKLFGRVVFKASAFDQVSRYSVQQLEQRLVEFINSGSRPDSLISDLSKLEKLPLGEGDKLNYGGSSKTRRHDRYIAKLKLMAKDMHTVFNSQEEADISLNRYLSLCENLAFADLGTGFLLSLMNHESLKNHVAVELEISSKQTGTMRFQYGDQKANQVHQAMEYILSIINNGSFDFRLATYGEPVSLHKNAVIVD